jgi:hypothetical protein
VGLIQKIISGKALAMKALWCMPGTFSWLQKHPLMKQVISGTRWQSQMLDKNFKTGQRPVYLELL